MLLKTSKENNRKGIRPHILPALVDGSNMFKNKLSKPEEIKKQLGTALKVIGELEQELANQREARFQEGFDAGKKTGYKKGLDEINAQIKHFAELVGNIKAEQSQFVQSSNEFLLDFVLKITEKLIGSGRLDELKIDEKKLQGMIGEVVGAFPESVNYIFHVHKETVAVLETNFEKIKNFFREDVKIIISEAPDLKPCDCIIETDFGALDGRLETHFRQIKNVIINRKT